MPPRHLLRNTFRFEPESIRERIDTAQMLRIAEHATILRDEGVEPDDLVEVLRIETQGAVTPRKRLNEALAVWHYWGMRLDDENELMLAAMRSASWHALLEPVRHDRMPGAKVVPFVRQYVAEHARWPGIDVLRNHVGLAPTRRRTGQQDDQETLDLD